MGYDLERHSLAVERQRPDFPVGTRGSTRVEQVFAVAGPIRRQKLLIGANQKFFRAASIRELAIDVGPPIPSRGVSDPLAILRPDGTGVRSRPKCKPGANSTSQCEYPNIGLSGADVVSHNPNQRLRRTAQSSSFSATMRFRRVSRAR